MALLVCAVSQRMALFFRNAPSFRKNHRGAVSLVFSLSALVTLGAVGLATEGGSWYVEKRRGQNAADAAAIAGAAQLAAGSASYVTTSASAAAGKIGYPSSSLSVTTGHSSGAGNFTAGGSPTNAVRATITTDRPRLFSALFGSGNVTISEAAVAGVLAGGGSACILSFAGGTSFTGNNSTATNDCVIASNATGSDAISVSGSATVSATSMVSSGGCSGCTSSSVTLTDPPSVLQPPTPDPFAAAGAVTLPTFQGSTCRSMPNLKGTVNLTPSTTQAFCSGQDLKLTNGNTVNLAPGTYFFYNSNIDLQGGLLECTTCTAGGPGVTIILTGSNSGANTGSININGNATVQLNAPVTNSWNSAFNGILFYRDSRASATGNGNQAAVQINGGASTVLDGGMYFPSSRVTYNGNMSTTGNTLSTCTDLVAYGITLTGNSSLDVSGCSTVGAPVPLPQYIALVM